MSFFKENTNLASLARFTEMILIILASDLMHEMVWKINKRCTMTIHFNVLSIILYKKKKRNFVLFCFCLFFLAAISLFGYFLNCKINLGAVVNSLIFVVVCSFMVVHQT